MNQAPTEAQSLSLVDMLIEAPPPAPSAPFSESFGPQVPRTPLGEPLEFFTELLLAADPVEWHMQYWFDLFLSGVMRGVDATLMLLRIEIEQTKISDQLGIEVRRAWRCHRTGNHDGFPVSVSDYLRSFGEVEQRFLRDLDRLLADKGPRTRIYLYQLEKLMVNSVRDGKTSESCAVCEKLTTLWLRLREEEIADAIAVIRQKDGISCAPNQRKQSLEDIQADWNAVSDLEMFD
ncbi:hypothetical protein MMC22_003355 [Lobaria immixta]|nr:hypothetical protein [Lobaria immixta]